MSSRDGDSVRFEVEYWQQVLSQVREVNDSIIAASEAVDVISAHLVVLRAFGPSIVDGDPHLEAEYRGIEQIVNSTMETMKAQRASLGTIVKLVRGRAEALGGELGAEWAQVDC